MLIRSEEDIVGALKGEMLVLTYIHSQL